MQFGGAFSAQSVRHNALSNSKGKTLMDTNKRTIRFEKEKETKNTIKFNEIPEKGQPAVIGSLYLQKWVAGDARAVSISLELDA
jgi:hypothetical protein